ncbi:hypothetical protein D3C76_1319630 [compost metagenome]
MDFFALFNPTHQPSDTGLISSCPTSLAIKRPAIASFELDDFSHVGLYASRIWELAMSQTREKHRLFDRANLQ